MIRDGDFFTVNDLKQSVNQIVNANVREWWPSNGDVLLNQSPQMYADNQIKQFADIKSSAKNLDRQLADSGYKTKYKFSYDYNIAGLTSEQIVGDAYKLEYFYRLATSDKPFGALAKRKELKQLYDDAARVSYYYAQYIWALNPDSRFDYASRWHPQQHWGFVLSFLLGVGFGFHPKDVYEFTTNHTNPNYTDAQRKDLYNKQLDFKIWCAKFGVDTGCLVLCPEHQEKLRKILTGTDTPYFIQWLGGLVRRR